MNRPIQVKELLITLLLGGLLFVGLSAAAPSSSLGVLEYRVIDETFPPNTLQPRLNELAAEGWRVISLSPTSVPAAMGGASYLIVFERLKKPTP